MKLLVAAAVIGFGAACTAGRALADDCSGREHAGNTLIGRLAANIIARDMDCRDQPYAARTYEESFRGPVGHRQQWKRGPNHGYVITNREYYRGTRLCRDFTQIVYRRGREFDRDGTACRRPNGEWEFM